MNCKTCGTLMGDMDLFCKVCGAKNEKNTEEAVLGESFEQNVTTGKGTVESVSKSKDNNEFTWNVYEFPKPKKTEEIDIQWPTEDYRKPKRKELEAEEPICWNLDRKPKKPTVEKPSKREDDAFFESLEFEFENTRKNIINEYEAVKNRKSVFEDEPLHSAEKMNGQDPMDGQRIGDGSVGKEAGRVEQETVREDFGAGLPNGFFEAVVPREKDLPIQGFDDLPGGYPQRRGSVLQSDAEDTKEATKKADRSQFRITEEQKRVGLTPKKGREQAAPEPWKNQERESVAEKTSVSESPLKMEEQHRTDGKTEEQSPDDVEQTVENMQTDSKQGKEDLGEMEKFFTFSKKSEEFQKLLDQEYEKIQQKNGERSPVSDNRISSAIKDTLNFSLMEDDTAPLVLESQMDARESEQDISVSGSKERAQEIPAAGSEQEAQDRSVFEPSEREWEIPVSKPSEGEREIPVSETEDEPERFDFIPRKDRKKKMGKGEMAAAEQIYQAQEAEKATTKRSIYPEPEAARGFNAEEPRRNPYAGHLAEMAAARESFFRDETGELIPVTRSFAQEPTGTNRQETPSTEVLVTVAVKSSGSQGTTTRQTVSMNPITGGDPIITTETSVDPVPGRVGMTEGKTETHRQEAACVQEASGRNTAARPETSGQGTVSKQEAQETVTMQRQGTVQQASGKQPEAVSDNIKKHNDGLPFETIPEQKADDFWLNYQAGSPTEKKKISWGKIAVAFICVLLVVEIVALSVTFLMPSSKAAKMVTNVQVQMVKGIQSGADTITGWFGKEEKKPKADADKEKNPTSAEKEPVTATEPSPLPQADKKLLIEKALSYNKNIQIIAKSDTLVFEEAKDYGLKDLNDSVPISNNIWFTDQSGNPVYYDQELVNTLIDYDSRWIDYVNVLDQGVFQILKPDSKAYMNAKAFSGAGKIYEALKSLTIGEIRQGEKGFYVFTQEVIEKNEHGKLTTLNTDWIYYLEPVDGKLFVVNYI